MSAPLLGRPQYRTSIRGFHYRNCDLGCAACARARWGKLSATGAAHPDFANRSA
jgi:hypothetical protein